MPFNARRADTQAHATRWLTSRSATRTDEQELANNVVDTDCSNPPGGNGILRSHRSEEGSCVGGDDTEAAAGATADTDADADNCDDFGGDVDDGDGDCDDVLPSIFSPLSRRGNSSLQSLASRASRASSIQRCALAHVQAHSCTPPCLLFSRVSSFTPLFKPLPLLLFHQLVQTFALTSLTHLLCTWGCGHCCRYATLSLAERITQRAGVDNTASPTLRKRRAVPPKQDVNSPRKQAIGTSSEAAATLLPSRALQANRVQAGSNDSAATASPTASHRTTGL